MRRYIPMMLFVVAFPVWAETPEEIVERLAAHRVVYGSFEQQQQLADLDFPLNSAGEFIFWRDRGLYLVTREPFFQALTLTPDGVIYWDEDGTGSRDQRREGLIQRETGRTLLAFFSADLELIDARFYSQWQMADDEDDGWQLALTPRQSQVRRQIRRALLRGNDTITALTLEAANGDVTELHFFRVNTADAPGPEQCRWFAQDDARQCPAVEAE